MSDFRHFQLVRMFHPTQYVPSLAGAEQFFQRVFGRSSTQSSTILKDLVPPNSGFPIDYSTFTLIRDVLIDSVDPKRFVFHGVQMYPAVDAPSLQTTGWYVEGINDLYKKLRSNGFTLTALNGDPMEGDEPGSPISGGKPMFFTVPEETGIRYQFYSNGPFMLDARTKPDWILPPVEDDCPLGLQFCAHHTIMTLHPKRVQKLFVDILGGTIIDEGRNDALGATSSFVALADAIIEFAVPDQGTPAHTDLGRRAPRDLYHALTWKVEDLDRVERHLANVGVDIKSRSADMLITDPATGYGTPWGFTTSLRPKDLRKV